MKSITIGVTVNLGNYESLRVDVVDECPDWAIEAIDDALKNVGRTDPDMCAAIDSFRARAFGDVPILVRRTQAAVAARELEESVAAKPEKPTQNGNTERIIDQAKLDRVCSKCGTALTEADAVSSALFNSGAVVCRKCRYPGLESSKQAQPPLETTEPVCVVCGLSAPNTGGLSAGGKCAACMEFDAKSEAAKPKPTQKTITPTQTPKTPPITKPAVQEPAKDPTAAPTYTCEACGITIARVQHDVSQLFNNRDLCKACMKSQPLERAA